MSNPSTFRSNQDLRRLRTAIQSATLTLVSCHREIDQIHYPKALKPEFDQLDQQLQGALKILRGERQPLEREMGWQK